MEKRIGIITDIKEIKEGKDNKILFKVFLGTSTLDIIEEKNYINVHYVINDLVLLNEMMVNGENVIKLELLIRAIEVDNLGKEWKRMYEYASKYYEKNGHLEVPAKFKTNDGYSYDVNGKIKLGDWVSNQRRRVLPESEKGQLLSKIGMRFEVKIIHVPWEEMYRYAKNYYEKNGNLEVPFKFKTNDGYSYDENGKIKLGEWLTYQRSKTLPESEKGQLLSKIGMRFEILNWEKMYGYAKKYYEKNGHLRVLHDFIMNEECEYDDKGAIKLGQWISTQREKIDPVSERGKLLSSIGMIWNVRINNREIKKICMENYIDFELNKKVVFCIPVSEMVAKIDFLQEKGIPVVDEKGILNEIFSMSSLDMKENFGVELEDIINNYALKLSNEKGRGRR